MNQLRKSERLNNFRLKQLVFNEGRSFKAFPFRIFWNCISQNTFVYKKSPAIIASAPINNIQSGYKKKHYDIAGGILPQNAVFLFPAKVIFSVSKKIINKASDRNYIKRLIRESYRKNKLFFYSFLKEKSIQCFLAIDYIGAPNPNQKEVEKHLVVSLQKLIKEIEKKTKRNNNTK